MVEDSSLLMVVSKKKNRVDKSLFSEFNQLALSFA